LIIITAIVWVLNRRRTMRGSPEAQNLNGPKNIPQEVDGSDVTLEMPTSYPAVKYELPVPPSELHGDTSYEDNGSARR